MIYSVPRNVASGGGLTGNRKKIMINRGAGTNGDLSPSNLTKFSFSFDLNFAVKMNSGGFFLCFYLIVFTKIRKKRGKPQQTGNWSAFLLRNRPPLILAKSSFIAFL